VQDQADIEFQKLRAAYLVELEASMTASLKDDLLFPRWVHVMLPGESHGHFDVWKGVVGSMKLKVDQRADGLEAMLLEQNERLEALGEALSPAGFRSKKARRKSSRFEVDGSAE
jgi:hypothetical protein